MLFWIWVIMLVAGLALMWYYDKKYVGYNTVLEVGSGFLIAFGIFGTVVAGIILIICNTNVDGEIALMEKRYESLVYQYENNIYENDNDLGKKELMNDIRDWNETLASRQAGQHDFWLGIFIPDIYDQLEFIELK